MASEVGFGAMNMRDAELVNAAIDRGINYIDTAYVYQNGQNEELIGRVLQGGKRDKVFLVSKAGRHKDLKSVPDEITTSLKRLRTDHVDLMLFHVAHSRKEVLDEDYMRVFEDARKKGYTRFIGISAHSNQAEAINAAVDSNHWEAVLTGYNYYSPPEVTQAIKRAREAGLAIIGMKNLITTNRPRKPFPDIREDTMKGITNQQALLKWVLEDPYVDTIIPGMTSFEQLEDDLAIMGMKLSFDERRRLQRYGELKRGAYCAGVAGCTGCLDACPMGVDVCELNRCVNYYYGYGDIELARENYDALPETSKVDVCNECDECAVRCINGLNLTERIQQARKLFSA
jgi:predicted aldo/keto reductase-like oxidoreductase